MEELQKIQCELVCQKAKRHPKFGYMYRNAEDILTSVKPLLSKYGCTLVTTEKTYEQNGNNVLETITTITNSKGESVSSSSVVAVDVDTKIGGSLPQVWGIASSYSRKKGLQNLLILDESDVDDIAAIKDASLSAQDVVDLINLSTNMDELSAIWKKYKGFQTNKDVIAAKNNKKKELSDGNK